MSIPHYVSKQQHSGAFEETQLSSCVSLELWDIKQGMHKTSGIALFNPSYEIPFHGKKKKIDGGSSENEICSTLASLWGLKIYLDLQSLGSIHRK